MTNFESKFNDIFSNWETRLPPDALEHRKRGKIVKAGWGIWYLFGSDEKGDYLDYYASHRMTDATGYGEVRTVRFDVRGFQRARALMRW